MNTYRYSVFTIGLALLGLASCKPEAQPNDVQDEPGAPVAVAETPAIAYQLVQTYPHDTGAYTQGLIYTGTELLEGTGQLGESNVRRVALASGKVLQEVENKPDIFGEGIAILNGKLFQLTWQNQVAYQYDARTLKLEKTFFLKTEGWGLTHNGTHLLQSDGSSNLYVLDPATFQELSRIGVYDHLGPKANLNELEFANGFVYANIWQTNQIAKIDPASGRIVGYVDLTETMRQAGIAPNPYSEKGPDVLNGIAWDSAGQRFFVTGKYWPKLFEIKLP